MQTSNPLLKKFNTPFQTPPFNEIKNEHFLPAVRETVAVSKKSIDDVGNNTDTPTLENTISELEKYKDKVNSTSAIFFNLHSAETNEELQKLAKEISPMLSEFENDIVLNEKLFNRIKFLYEKKDSLELNTEEATLLKEYYKEFIRNGALLNKDDKNKLREIDKKLSNLSLKFGDNVLSETNSFTLDITDSKDLNGLPENVIEAASMCAKDAGKENTWRFTLHYPSYLPFMTYANNRELRKKMMLAFSSRAYKNDGHDNQQIIIDIIKSRNERAKLLGYHTHADFVLEARMAKSPKTVKDFLENILTYAKPCAEKEIEELTEFMKKLGGPEKLEKWDYAYYSEKLKKEKFNIDDEILRPYFKLDNVIDGIFKVAKKLYEINFISNKDIQLYHPDVKAYEVKSNSGEHLGIFYADFFPRPGKRNGAWMSMFSNQKKINGTDERPLVSIVCNFTKPTETKPSLLSFGEVETLFHEFGHALHALLSNCTFPSLSGPNVYWDFVELPSQIMENWVYEKECLDLFAAHFETGEKIPFELIKKIKESSSFLEGCATLRQLSFGFLDMAWHTTNPDEMKSVGEFEYLSVAKTTIIPSTKEQNFSCSFSHIFQGGYSSGYYSYKWAEVLDADAFEFFMEKGIFNPEVSRKFCDFILSKGGTEHPMELYKKFRGREPSNIPLLKRAGLIKTNKF